MRHVVRAVSEPRFVRLEFGEAVEHLALGGGRDALQFVDARDQRRTALGT
jgi:hypothetical protein